MASARIVGVSPKDVAVEFVECAIHQVLFLRGVYPEGVFKRCAKYGVPMMKCLHPWTNSFVAEYMTSLRKAMDTCKRQISRFDLVLINDGCPLETYVFEFGNEREGMSQYESEDNVDSEFFDASSFGEAEYKLRSLLLKIVALIPELPDLVSSADESDLSFTFCLHTNVIDAMHRIDEDGREPLWCAKDDEEREPEASHLESKKMFPVCNMSKPFPLHIFLVRG